MEWQNKGREVDRYVTRCFGKSQTAREVYRDGGRAEIWIDNVLSKLIDSERERLMATERKLCEQLREFERTYSMDSEPFYERFERGQLADEMDYFDWAARVEMVKNLRDRLPL
ncbi:MAG: hypothetical protein J7M27_01860 [Candidatus Latescibacteria bacterium]|nr:hypothetical protein [Candidatus Latescibacterota bacterium]